jgi:drug/metabolite transporter (DMT)-like permease
MQSMFPFVGEALSLLTAVVWALAVTLFRKSGETVHPLALNVFKNILALVLLIPTIWLFGQTLWLQASTRTYVILFLSGAVGIGIGDTLFFQSLNRLGAGLTGIVVCMYSPFIIAFSHIWLHESLAQLQLFGVLLIIFAVLFTTVHKTSRSDMPARPFLAIIYGVLASAAMAAGVVLMKPLLGKYPVVWVAEIRLLGGMAALAIILLIHSGRKRILASLMRTSNWRYTLSGSLLGAYVSMVLWIAGMKYTQASIASALNQTSTLFIFVFAGLLLKEPINARRAIGIATAFIGAFLVSIFK